MQIASTTRPAATVVTRTPPPTAHELSVMMPFGRYSVQAQVGIGGMGTVYRGTQLSLGRPVAIKVLRVSDGYDYAFEDRFRREARAMAALNHPNIVAIYDYGHLGSEFLFFVMEFVDGTDLGEIMRQGRMTPELALGLLPQICAALEYAHSKGIVHRDIKPANIMLTANDEVKVMDFGIARVLGSARQTKTGRLIGTLEYMSPEQMRSQETDARSDVYSLGILLYEMLTGRVPFQSTSDYELMRAQVEDEPIAPRDFKGDIPLAVELAILRALAKDPAARFQSATEFRAALISAVPAAALKTETAEPLIKATRFAATEPQFDEPISTARMPGSQSAGFDAHTGTYTLRLPSFLLTAREQFTARFGHLNWKHYGSAAALLAIVIGLTSLRRDNQPAPVTTPEPQPTATQPAPVQPLPVPSAPAIIAPLSQETAVRPLDPQAAEAENPAPAKQTAPRAKAAQSQVAARAQPRPTRSAQTQRQAAPTPTPTPQQAQKQEPKKKWWEKAAEVGVGVTDAIIRKKRGRP